MQIPENLQHLDITNYNPLNDVIFKFIFGKEERKQITIDFLNAVLMDTLHHPIRDLRFSNAEMSPENESDKATRFDIACVLDSGEQVDVEVQVINEKNMERRTLYYWAQMYLMSLPRGYSCNRLKPAITVNLLAFNLLPQKEPHAVYGLYNIQTGHQLTEDLELHFLEIPKYAAEPPKPVAAMTKMERWLAYFANKLDKKGKEELAMSEPAIRSAMDAAQIFLNNTEERRRYINREMAIMDREAQLEYATEKGEDKLGRLSAILLNAGKTADAAKASIDRDYRNKLYEQYGI